MEQAEVTLETTATRTETAFTQRRRSLQTRERRLFMTRVWWVSAMPSSHGTPACLIEVNGDAPVPPVSPAMTR